MEEIEVVGEKLEDAAFPLINLKENVLEMPPRFCLNLLSTDELRQIQRAFDLYGFLPEGDHAPEERGNLMDLLEDTLKTPGFYERALEKCSSYARNLMELMIEQGGTSGDIETIRNEFSSRYGAESLYYAPAARTVTRLGLAYTVPGACRNYYLLPEGVVTAFKRIRQEALEPAY
jgi:hypothetical protein